MLTIMSTEFFALSNNPLTGMVFIDLVNPLMASHSVEEEEEMSRLLG